jgi:hypothetical protein
MVPAYNQGYNDYLENREYNPPMLDREDYDRGWNDSVCDSEEIEKQKRREIGE